MSLSWLERHEQVIKQCLKSKKAFNTYLTNNSTHMRRAYLAFRALVKLFSESVNNSKNLEKKVNNLEHAESCIKSALIYVKDSLNKF